MPTFLILPFIEYLLCLGHCAKWWGFPTLCFPLYQNCQGACGQSRLLDPFQPITECLGWSPRSFSVHKLPRGSLCTWLCESLSNGAHKAMMIGQSWVRVLPPQRGWLLGEPGGCWGKMASKLSLQRWLFAHTEGMKGRAFQTKRKLQVKSQYEHSKLRRLEANCEGPFVILS